MFLLLLLSGGTASAQGTVNFSNHTSLLDSPPDRLVRFGPGATAFNPFATNNAPAATNLVPGLRVQLYYGPPTAQESELVAISTAPATLRGSTSASAGIWFGGTRTLDGIPIVGTYPLHAYANLQVRVWDISLAPSYEAAVADPSYPGLLGKSAMFFHISTYDATTHPIDPIFMANFQGFTIDRIPEPATPALMSLALGCLLLVRRNTTRRRVTEKTG